MLYDGEFQSAHGEGRRSTLLGHVAMGGAGESRDRDERFGNAEMSWHEQLTQFSIADVTLSRS